MKIPRSKEYLSKIEVASFYPLELRLNDKEYLCNLEIVYWKRDSSNKDFCYTLAYWAYTREGFELKFIGSRPLDAGVRWPDFGKLVRLGQHIADDFYYQEQSK